jgi:hypothetical protein
MLKVGWQAVLKGSFPLRLEYAAFCQRFHGNIEDFGKLIHGLSRAFLKLGFSTAYVAESSVRNASVNSKPVLCHFPFG